MFRTAAAILALASSASLALAATDEELRQQIAGSWGQDPTCSTGRLTFNTDGTFTLGRPDRNETGTWQIAGGMLTGVVSDGSSRPEVTISFGDGTLAMTSGDRTETLSRCSVP
jgi:hypothetical protein